jgi:hypothetical protein
MSLDAKATVKIGEFSRKGKSRLVVKAADHDFQAKETITPYGILLPDHNRLYLYCTQGRVTSDFIADCITDCWQQMQVEQPQVQTLLLYHLIFAQTERISIRLDIIHANRGRFYSEFELKRPEQYFSKQIISLSAYGCEASNSIRLSCPAQK